MSVTDLVDLRIAAALVHDLPGLRARVCSGEHVIEVVGPGVALPSDQTAVFNPCEFRNAVARAHRLQQVGRPFDLAGLGLEDDLAISVSAPPGGVARTGDLFRVPRDDHHVWAFGTPLPADVAHPLGQDLVDTAQPLPEITSMGLRRDLATDITVVFAQSRAAAGSEEEAPLVDLLESLLARWSVHELVEETSGAKSDGRRL